MQTTCVVKQRKEVLTDKPIFFPVRFYELTVVKDGLHSHYKVSLAEDISGFMQEQLRSSQVKYIWVLLIFLLEKVKAFPPIEN